MKNREIEVGVHNSFEIVVSDASTGKEKRREKCYNVILNKFWTNSIFRNESDRLGYIHFGSGTATPLATDTTLTTFIAALACSTSVVDSSQLFSSGVIKRTRSIRLNAGAYTGATISEVGFAAYSTSAYLATKSLIKDSNGNPLSITIGATDVVDIYGTFYVKVPLPLNGGEIEFNSTIGSGTLLGFLLALGGTSNWSAPAATYLTGWLYPKSIKSDNPEGEYYSAAVTTTYTESTKTMLFTLANIIAANGNIGGYSSVQLAGMEINLPCTGFTQPVITKEVIGTGDGTTVDFPCAFAKILNNGTAKLYVNDIEVSATFDYLAPNIKSGWDYGHWLKPISALPMSTAAPFIFENPYYTRHTLASIYAGSFNLYASNDQSTWTLVASRSSGSAANVAINQTYKAYRYWKLEPYTAGGSWSLSYILPNTPVNKPVHAATAPASGSTVALTYQPNCIAKDANHVVNNVTVTVVFNEYTP